MDRRRRKVNKAPQAGSPFGAKKSSAVKTALTVTGAVLAVCILVLAAALLGWLKIPGITLGHQPADTAPVETVPDTVIHFVAGGDLNVTDRSVAAGKTETGYDYGSVFLDVMPVLSGSDLTALNFEGTLSGEPYGAGSASAPQQLVQALRSAGVDFLQTANSCTIMGGPLGMASTLSGIRDAGIEPLGSYGNNAESEKSGGFVIREVQGIRIALVAFTKGMSGSGLPNGFENCVNLLYEDYYTTYQKVNEAGITKVLQAAKAQKPDLIISLVHWGSEFNKQISKSQTKIVELMQGQGVDAIIGTHSHYVQKMTYDPESGQFIAYSLGDFFGDADKADTNYSVLLDLEITKSGATGDVKITGFDYTPIYTFYEENKAKILRIREAMTAYERGSLGRVSQEAYEGMKTALSRIESRITAD